MQAVLTQTFQTLMRPARAGQAIILIALGFVALIGFTGIATDTGLLFIRYTTLSRATDSAAVAAAATLRQGTDYLSMVNAATHYLVLHGISATSVLVETCATDVLKYEENEGINNPTALDDQKAYNDLVATSGEILCTRGAAKLVRVSAQATAQTTFLSLFGFNNIALTASSVSQAASLDAVVLLDSSYSQAYDTRDDVRNSYTSTFSNSKPNGDLTVYDNYQDFTSNANSSGLNLAPYDPANPTGGTAGGKYPNGSIRAECRWPVTYPNPKVAGNSGPYVYDSSGNITIDLTDPNFNGDATHNGNGNLSPNYYYGGCCNAPVNVTLPSGTYDLSSVLDTNKTGYFTGTTYDGTDPELSGGSGSINFQNATPPAGDARAVAPEIVGTVKRDFTQRNYVPLICRPFRDVRVGAYTFLQNVNFQAGDRTFMVTFDTSVHELTVAGEYNNTTDFPAATNAFPGLTDRNSAIYALYRYGGVETSPTGFQSGCPSLKAPPYNYSGWTTGLVPPPSPDLFDLSQSLGSNNSKGSYLYETAAPCTDTDTGGAVLAGQSLLTNPAWIRRDAVWVMVVMSAGYPNHTPGQGQIGNGTRPGGQPNISVIPANFFTAYPPTTNAWGAVSAVQQRDIQDPGFCPWATFCDFKTANATALASTSKQVDGLPDTNVYDVKTGSAIPNITGVTLPNALAENSKYCTAANGLPQANPIWWTDTLNAPGMQTKLNHWGGVPGNLTADNDPNAQYNDWQVPGGYRVACTTADPDIRHFCMNPSSGIINDTSVACDVNYGAMDFARDMVDYAALDQWTSQQHGNFITMYSIFFPRKISNYPSRPNTNDCPNGPATCSAAAAPSEGDIGSYIMGAKFMRYIADAGDNGTIDNHVQAWYRNEWQTNVNWTTGTPLPTALPPDNFNGSVVADYGSVAEDPCAYYDFDENPAGKVNNPRVPAQAAQIFALPDQGYAHQPDASLAYPTGYGYEDLYRYNCGNYYFAGNAAAVQQAFVSISNRLFVQIAH